MRRNHGRDYRFPTESRISPSFDFTTPMSRSRLASTSGSAPRVGVERHRRTRLVPERPSSSFVMGLLRMAENWAPRASPRLAHCRPLPQQLLEARPRLERAGAPGGLVVEAAGRAPPWVAPGGCRDSKLSATRQVEHGL